MPWAEKLAEIQIKINNFLNIGGLLMRLPTTKYTIIYITYVSVDSKSKIK